MKDNDKRFLLMAYNRITEFKLHVVERYQSTREGYDTEYIIRLPRLGLAISFYYNKYDRDCLVRYGKVTGYLDQSYLMCAINETKEMIWVHDKPSTIIGL